MNLTNISVFLLILLTTSCSMMRIKPHNVGVKKLYENKNQSQFFKNYQIGNKERFKASKELTVDEVKEDIKQLKFYIRNSHPDYITDKKIDSFLASFKPSGKIVSSKKLLNYLKNIFTARKELNVSVVEKDKKSLDIYYKEKFQNAKKEVEVDYIGEGSQRISVVKLVNTVIDLPRFNKIIVKALDTSRGVIFDLTENSNFNYQTDLLLRGHLYGIYPSKDYIPSAHEPKPITKRVYIRNWLTNIAGSKNLVDEKLKIIEKRSLQVDKDFKEQLQNNLRAYTKSEGERSKNANSSYEVYDLTKLKTATFIEQSRYKKPVVVLISKKCRMVCERFVANIKSLSNVTLIGNSTAGDFYYEDFLKASLPNSHIEVKIPYSKAYYRSAEKYRAGIKPSITTSKIKESYNIARKTILSKKEFNNLSINSKKIDLFFIRPYFYGTIIDYDLYLNSKDKKDFIGETNGNEFLKYTVDRGAYKVYQNAQEWTVNDVNSNDGAEVYFAQPFRAGTWHGDAVLIRIPRNTGRFYMKYIKGRPTDPKNENSHPSIFKNPFE